MGPGRSCGRRLPRRPAHRCGGSTTARRDGPPAYRRGPKRCIQAILILAAAAVPVSLDAQGGDQGRGLASDPFVAALLGEWEGAGVYDGSPLSLTRVWTLELGGQFLKADMRVSMVNGASFGALTYWRPDARGGYEVRWMDGMGRAQTLEVLPGPEPTSAFAIYLDALTEDGVQWRRWDFELTGADGYVERLYRREGEGWVLLTEFTFRRVEAPAGSL